MGVSYEALSSPNWTTNSSMILFFCDSRQRRRRRRRVTEGRECQSTHIYNYYDLSSIAFVQCMFKAAHCRICIVKCESGRRSFSYFSFCIHRFAVFPLILMHVGWMCVNGPSLNPPPPPPPPPPPTPPPPPPSFMASTWPS